MKHGLAFIFRVIWLYVGFVLVARAAMADYPVPLQVGDAERPSYLLVWRESVCIPDPDGGFTYAINFDCPKTTVPRVEAFETLGDVLERINRCDVIYYVGNKQVQCTNFDENEVTVLRIDKTSVVPVKLEETVTPEKREVVIKERVERQWVNP